MHIIYCFLREHVRLTGEIHSCCRRIVPVLFLHVVSRQADLLQRDYKRLIRISSRQRLFLYRLMIDSLLFFLFFLVFYKRFCICYKSSLIVRSSRMHLWDDSTHRIDNPLIAFFFMADTSLICRLCFLLFHPTIASTVCSHCIWKCISSVLFFFFFFPFTGGRHLLLQGCKETECAANMNPKANDSGWASICMGDAIWKNLLSRRLDAGVYCRNN